MLPLKLSTFTVNLVDQFQLGYVDSYKETQIEYQ